MSRQAGFERSENRKKNFGRAADFCAGKSGRSFAHPGDFENPSFAHEVLRSRVFPQPGFSGGQISRFQVLRQENLRRQDFSGGRFSDFQFCASEFFAPRIFGRGSFQDFQISSFQVLRFRIFCAEIFCDFQIFGRKVWEIFGILRRDFFRFSELAQFLGGHFPKIQEAEIFLAGWVWNF